MGLKSFSLISIPNDVVFPCNDIPIFNLIASSLYHLVYIIQSNSNIYFFWKTLRLLKGSFISRKIKFRAKRKSQKAGRAQRLTHLRQIAQESKIFSCAFEDTDITAILGKGLSSLPEESRYARVVREVMAFHTAHPDDWEECFRYIKGHHGYDKYPGNCHIIPNIAVMILALLYGNGNFSDTLNIYNRCGWDTDCNVGNVATIMGVRGGPAAIGDEWRRPVDDFLACSSVVGSLNIQDIP